jgi:4'-phosphopantetheinyl transferase
MSVIPLPSPKNAGISLWLIDLDTTATAPDDPSLTELLNADEIAKANRFRFVRDAHRYRSSHTALRRILSQETGIPPRDLEFVEGRFGKPALRTLEPLHFNMSHSGGWALVGLSSIAPIGVDIEVPRPMDDLASMAERNFSPPEFVAFQAVESARQLQAFLQGWTRKEACLKALGSGLSIEPGGFEAGIGLETRPVTVGVDGHPCHMHVFSVALPVGALAAGAWIEPSHHHMAM